MGLWKEAGRAYTGRGKTLFYLGDGTSGDDDNLSFNS